MLPPIDYSDIWPFRKKPVSKKVIYKSGRDFFESQCEFGHTTIEQNTAIVAIVLDAKKEFGLPTSVWKDADGLQSAILRIASDEGGFTAFSKTASAKGDRLKPDDVVLWVPSVYVEEIGKQMPDSRSGWVGLIRAKIKPEIDLAESSFSIACRYDQGAPIFCPLGAETRI
jgi:hypothetical protein